MEHRPSFFTIVPFVLAALLGAAGCGGDGVSSTDKAKQAYDGLDASIDKAIELGFDGFNAASSANIPEQTAKGDVTGTMTITGQVDQGASNNKTMNLTETLKAYSDDKLHTYDTDPAALPTLSMKLSKIPDGTLDGTLSGKFILSGDIKGPVTLSLTFTGNLMAGTNGAKVARKPGTTHITGTAKSDYGTYDVDITR
jgi:hypothetical protein